MPDQHAMNPRVLLVEDDPISGRVLAAAVAALPARVDTACSCAAALELAARFRHDAWLIDAHDPAHRVLPCLRTGPSRQKPPPKSPPPPMSPPPKPPPKSPKSPESKSAPETSPPS